MGMLFARRTLFQSARAALGWRVAYNGTTTKTAVSDGPVIQDLHDDEVTWETWLRPDSAGEGNAGKLIDKETGWTIYLGAGGITVQVFTSTK